MSNYDDFLNFARQIEALNDVQKVKFAAQQASQLFDYLEDHDPIDRREVLNFLIGIAAIARTSLGYGLSKDAYDFLTDMFIYTNNETYHFDEADAPFEMVEDIYTDIQVNKSSEKYTRYVHSKLDEESAALAGNILLTFLTLEGEVNENDADIILMFLKNGYWQEVNNSPTLPKNAQPTISPSNPSPAPAVEDEGYGLVGFLLVFFLNLIGLIIALLLRKRRTRKAAIITFVVMMVMSILLGVTLFLLVYFHVIDISKFIPTDAGTY